MNAHSRATVALSFNGPLHRPASGIPAGTASSVQNEQPLDISQRLVAHITFKVNLLSGWIAVRQPQSSPPRRTFQPSGTITVRAAIEECGLEHARPYDLRHSFASLLLHEGRNVIYVARQLGHDARLTLTVYGHVLEELDGSPQLDVASAIQAAREARVRVSFAPTLAAAT
jgi:Phage integrase family